MKVMEVEDCGLYIGVVHLGGVIRISWIRNLGSFCPGCWE